MKSIPAINPAIMEIVKAHTPVIDQNCRCVALSWCTYHYASFPATLNILVTFQAKNSIRRAPASSALTSLALKP